jgi:hypothetical protein
MPINHKAMRGVQAVRTLNSKFVFHIMASEM